MPPAQLSPKGPGLSTRSRWLVALVLVASMLLCAAVVMRYYVLPKWQSLSASASARNLELAFAAYEEQRGHTLPGSLEERVQILYDTADLNPPAAANPAAQRQQDSSASPPSLAESYPFLQKNGRAIDPWDQPLFFDQELAPTPEQTNATAISSPRVLSAGPDKKPYTKDDIDRSLADEAVKTIANKARP